MLVVGMHFCQVNVIKSDVLVFQNPQNMPDITAENDFPVKSGEPKMDQSINLHTVDLNLGLTNSIPPPADESG